MSDVVNLPSVPEGSDLELKRDLAIAGIAIRNRCSLQEAADTLGGVMTKADQLVDSALNKIVPPVRKVRRS